MNQRKIYGDEELGYRIIARDITPQQAGGYLEFAEENGLIGKINPVRLTAFKLRSEESE